MPVSAVKIENSRMPVSTVKIENSRMQGSISTIANHKGYIGGYDTGIRNVF